MFKTRELSDSFMTKLKPTGMFEGLVQMVKRDMTLDFQIRTDEVHIYYRGGRALVLKPGKDGYFASFDRDYCKQHRYEERLESLPVKLTSRDDLSKWTEALPFIKQTIDEHRGEKEKLEREYQQHVVVENNNAGGLKVANGTDYFIVDIEYANIGRCDLVAFKWHTKHRSSPGKRVRLALIEMKFGDDSLKGSSGLVKHVKDVEALLGDPSKKASLIKEMKTVFNQKRELGLIRSLEGSKEGQVHNAHLIEEISDEKPEFILLLAAHNPNSDVLLKVIEELEADKLLPMQHAELKISVANFMGYALYDNSVFDLETFKKTFSKQLYAKG